MLFWVKFCLRLSGNLFDARQNLRLSLSSSLVPGGEFAFNTQVMECQIRGLSIWF